jgi:hypothetical protein
MSIGLWHIEAVTLTVQLAQRWRWGWYPNALISRSLLPGRLLILISVREWADSKSIVRVGRLPQLKKPFASSRIEPATFPIFSTCTDLPLFFFTCLQPCVALVFLLSFLRVTFSGTGGVSSTPKPQPIGQQTTLLSPAFWPVWRGRRYQGIHSRQHSSLGHRSAQNNCPRQGIVLQECMLTTKTKLLLF